MCYRIDDLVHVSGLVYCVLGQWSCGSGVYHEPDAEVVPERNVYLYKLSGGCDQLGLYPGGMAAVPDAEKDASGGRTSLQQGVLLRTAGSGDGYCDAGDVRI